MSARRQSLEMFSSPRSPSSTMRIFSSAEYAGESAILCALALVLLALCRTQISA